MSPNMDMETIVEISVIDMCRTIKLLPTEYVKVGRLKALRFLPDPNLLNYEAPENHCYCPATVNEPPPEEEDEYEDSFRYIILLS